MNDRTNKSPQKVPVSGTKDAPRRSKKRRVVIEIEDELCKGCEICVTLCPLKVFENSDRLNRKGYHVPVVVNMDACNGCRLCDLLCPEFAIILSEQ